MKTKIIATALIIILFVMADARPPAYPKFELSSMDKRVYTSLGLRGRAVLIVFFARQCLPCRMEVPFLNHLHSKYPDTLTILAMAFMETDYNSLKALIKDWGIKYPVCPDPDGGVARAFENVVFPRSFLIDNTGKIIGDYSGLGEENNKRLFRDLNALQPIIKEYRARGPVFHVAALKESGKGSGGQGKAWQLKIISWLKSKKVRTSSKKSAVDYFISGNVSNESGSLKIEIVISNSGGVEEVKFSENLKPGNDRKLRNLFFVKLKSIPYVFR